MRWAFARGDLPPPSPSLEARVLPASGRQIDAVTNGWIRGRRCNKLPISTCSGGTPMKSTALTVLLTAAVLIPLTAGAQPRPGNPTTATVITKAEIDKIAATMQNVTTRDENARVVDIGDGWSMELGIIHRSKQRVLTVGEAKAQAAGRGNAQAAAGRGNAQAAAQTTPCGEQMANPPADALQGAITHDNQTEG